MRLDCLSRHEWGCGHLKTGRAQDPPFCTPGRSVALCTIRPGQQPIEVAGLEGR
jgi:hypothetical protein